MNRVLAGFRNLFGRRRVETDLAREVDAYLELLVAEKVTAGMTPATARRAARLELGTKDQVKEEVRDVRSGATLEQIGRDLRYGLRGLRRNPCRNSFSPLSARAAAPRGKRWNLEFTCLSYSSSGTS